MKKKYAFLLMGSQYNPTVHQACFEAGDRATYIYTARDFEEAKDRVRYCLNAQFGAMELCGAFGEEKAKEIIAMTQNKVAVGFVTHFPEHDMLFQAFFSPEQ